MDRIYEVTGELTDSRHLTLDEPVPLSKGKVRVTVAVSLDEEDSPSFPQGVPILGRGRGKLIHYIEDEDHLADFEEYCS